jgi:hypothetical protein
MNRFWLTKRPLGRILLDAGFITAGQLECALRAQIENPRPLGQILLGMGMIKEGELRAVLSIQKTLASFEGAVKAAAGERQLLGELLLEAGRITKDELEEALREQRTTKERIGEVLIRKGLLTRREIDALLAFQLVQGSPGEGPLKLGGLLVLLGQLTPEQLDEALQHQKESGLKLGEVLVKEGFTSREQVERGLGLQKKLLKAVIIALLSLAPVFGPAWGESGEAAAGERRVEPMLVSVMVRPRTQMKVVHQAGELVITQADLARGYVEAPAATSMEVRTNVGTYLLNFDWPEGLFTEVVVSGIGREVHLAQGESIMITQPELGMRVIELSYKMVLSREARPGTYAWPMMMSLNQI